MWTKEYQDYPEDTPLKHHRVTSGRGIVGCEMNEINGWGNTLHHFEEDRKMGRLKRFLERIDNENT